MNVSVTITFCVRPGEKHRRQMRQAAKALTDAKNSIQISQQDTDSKKLTVHFTIPEARQEDIVDHIGRTFWNYIEDYSDSAIGFSRIHGSRRRRGRISAIKSLIFVLAILFADTACSSDQIVTGPITTNQAGKMKATKPSDKEIVLTGQFAAPRQAVFDALTQSKHLVHWMKTTNMALVGCEVDARVGGTLRYVFQRPSGRKLEVRGAYTAFDAPRRFAYTETYDFTPLTVLVTTTLDEEDGKTIFKQTLRYVSKQERDDDFEPVSTSAKEVYPNLARYLAQGTR